MTFREWLIESIPIDVLRMLLSGWAPADMVTADDATNLLTWLASRPEDHPVFKVLLMVYGDDYRIAVDAKLSHGMRHLPHGE